MLCVAEAKAWAFLSAGSTQQVIFLQQKGSVLLLSKERSTQS